MIAFDDDVGRPVGIDAPCRMNARPVGRIAGGIDAVHDISGYDAVPGLIHASACARAVKSGKFDADIVIFEHFIVCDLKTVDVAAKRQRFAFSGH